MNAIYSHQVDLSNTTIGGLIDSSQFVNIFGMKKDTEERQYAEIGQRLTKIREVYSDLNQKDWAEKHGFNQTQYNNWEKGSRRIPVECAEKLSDTYGLSLDFVYRGRRDGLSDTALKKL